jgi:hypothetical protein
MANEAKRDFAASKVFADHIDLGPDNSTPAKRPPADKKSTEQAVTGLETKTGFRPPTEADLEPLPPVRIFVGHDSRPPTVPEQPVHSTPGERLDPKIDKVNRILNQGGLGGEIARDRLLDPYGSLDAKVQRDERRKKKGLPERAPSWRGLQNKFLALTQSDKNILREMGYHPEWIKNKHGETVECMLRDLEQYRKSIGEKV